MTDDTRQARIEAGDASDNTHPPLQKNEDRTILNDSDLRIDVRLQDDYLVFDVVRNPGTVHMHGHHIPIALAADAIGRERVSVAEAEAMLDRYFTNRFEAIMADGQHLAIGFLEQAESERTHLIALLVAAPAERGDETEVKP